MDAREQARQQVTQILARLVAKGLTQEGPAICTVRVPGESAMAVGDTEFNKAEVDTLSFDEAARSKLALAVHGAIYRIRGDAGAIVTTRQSWASRLAQLPEPMPVIFDEQVRQLGDRIGSLAGQATELSEKGAAALQRGCNVFLVDHEVLTIGFTAERAMLNAELLEKCAMAYILGRLTRRRIGKIPWLVRYIAFRRLRNDQKRAAESYARGEMPDRFSTY